MDNTWRYKSGTLLSALVAAGLLASCSGTTAPTPSASPSAKAVSKEGASATGLCAFISDATAAALNGTSPTAPGGAGMLFAPTQPPSGQTASCEFAQEAPTTADLIGGITEVSIEPTMQHGVNELTKLQAQASASSSDVNGNQIVWNPKTSILYMEFPDKNPVYVTDATGTDSILTVNDQAGETTPVTVGLNATPPAFLVTFAEHAADEITSGHVVTTSMCPQCNGWGSGPVLIDDKGQEVPNPIFVLDVYELLITDDTYGISGIGSSFTFLPSSNLKTALAEAARSMTVHPDCSNKGCVYPDFAMTGWSNATTRADGLKLGVNPAKVPDPTGGNLPVYTSVFDPCMCTWGGTFPPGFW